MQHDVSTMPNRWVRPQDRSNHTTLIEHSTAELHLIRFAWIGGILMCAAFWIVVARCLVRNVRTKCAGSVDAEAAHANRAYCLFTLEVGAIDVVVGIDPDRICVASDSTSVR